jgi:hypothetical protein
MSSAEYFNKASHALLDAEIKLNTISSQLEKLDREIGMLMSVQANLEENVRFLKESRVIVMANEYRKIKTDLQTVKTRQSFLRIDRATILKVEKQAEIVYNKAKLDYKKAYSLLHGPANNVLQFRKKNG